MKRFFGIIAESTLNGQNDGILDACVEARYAFYRRRSWVLNAREFFELGTYLQGPGDVGVFWKQILGVEAHYRRGVKGGMFYLHVTFDGLPTLEGVPRFSKDGLLELGVAFYI